MFCTHPLVQPVSVSDWGWVLLFTSPINHVFSAVAPKPYIVRDPVCSLGMIRWMWEMIYRETCSFSWKPSLVYTPCSLTTTRTLSPWRPGNLTIRMGSGGERVRTNSIPGKCACVHVCVSQKPPPVFLFLVFPWTVLLQDCIMFQSKVFGCFVPSLGTKVPLYSLLQWPVPHCQYIKKERKISISCFTLAYLDSFTSCLGVQHIRWQ